MSGLLAAFLSSFVATLLIIRFKHLHEQFSADSDRSGPQKFHTNIVPRVGGISIAIGLFIAIIFRFQKQILLSADGVRQSLNQQDLARMSGFFVCFCLTTWPMAR